MGNIWTRHILHSISLLFRVDIPYGVTVLDLGSGGGFPGIPLSIVREDLKFTLLDSVAKKTSVLERIVSETGLKNVSVLTSRAEELADQPGYKFDVVVARAVAPLSDLIGWCKPLFARRAPIHARAGERLNERRMKLNLPCLLALKGGDLEAETAAARRKEGDHMITTVDLVYVGMGDVGSEEKKLVVVEF